ncbi:MAG: ABC transporter permease [Actinomycetes bacterium]
MTQIQTPSKFTALKVSFPKVLKSEFIKFKSLKSNWITLALTVAAIIGFSVLSAILSEHRPNGGGDGEHRSTFERVMTGANFAILIISVLGSIMGSREYSSGMIRTSFTAVPKRLPVLFSKLITFVYTVLPLMLISIFAAFALGMSLFKHYGLAVMHLSDPFVSRALFGYAFYIVGLGILGLTIGTLTRHTASAIGIVIGGVLFLPALLGALLPTSWQKILEYLPSNAGGAFLNPTPLSINLLSPTLGALVFAGWIVLAIGGASYAMQKRDA